MNRIESLRKAMANEGVDLVALGPGAHMAWLVGVRPHADERPLLLCVTSSYCGFLMPSLESDSARQHTDLPFHPWSDSEGPAGAFSALLEHAGAIDAKSVVLDETMRADFAGLVQDALPSAKRSFCGSTVGALRLKKDDQEYGELKRNALIADAAMKAAWSELKPGMTELDVAGIARAHFASQDVKPLFTIVGAGGNGAFPHHQTGDTKLAVGDAIVMDIGAEASGYPSDITRMAILGEAPDGYEAVHKVVEAAVQAALAVTVPGALARDIDAAARTVITEAGYGEYFMHRTGHGLGVEVHEPPYITSTSDTVMEEGMVFSIEPGIYLPDRFGIRLEDIVILRKDGPEILSELPRDASVIEV